jgi:hypothetical protein
MKNQRLKQCAVSLLVVLSLFVSSVSACTCPHETQTSELSHCQPASQHSHDAQAESHHNETKPESVLVLALPSQCCGIQSAPRVSAVTKNIEIEKQALATSPVPVIEFVSISLIDTNKTADFVTPFYLSDSFHNLTPGRAPPRL